MYRILKIHLIVSNTIAVYNGGIMRIYPVSDLHNETEPWAPPGDKDGVLLVAGDIHTRHRAGEWLRDVAPLYKAVVAIPGNHDYWDDAAENTVLGIRETLRNVPNAYMLERNTVVIDDTRFIGCTLWTHVPPDSLLHVQNTIRDYERIRIAHGQTKLNVGVTNQWHVRDKEWLAQELAQPFEGTTVVMTHHAPSAQSIDNRYKDHVANMALNHGYHTNLDDWVKNLAFDAWIHGHTHHSFDYPFGSGRLICNPRGYAPRMLNPDFNEHLVLESDALRSQRRIVPQESYEDFWNSMPG